MSRTGVMSDRGREGGFILGSEEEAVLGVSSCVSCELVVGGWLRVGVDGGRIGAD